MKNNNGFTLIELTIVIAIIGILAAVAVPRFQDYIDNTNNSVAKTYAQDYCAPCTGYLYCRINCNGEFNAFDPRAVTCSNSMNFDDAIALSQSYPCRTLMPYDINIAINNIPLEKDTSTVIPMTDNNIVSTYSPQGDKTYCKSSRNLSATSLLGNDHTLCEY